MTALESLAADVSSREGLSGTLREKVVLHIADAAAAWIAGAHAPEGRLLSDFVRRQAGGLLDRVMLHCALARLSEIDDIHLASCITPGAIVVPAALTLAAEWRAPALAESIVAGYEAMVRLGAALNGPALLYRGIWPTYFIAPLGVAAAAARLLELDAAQTAHALGLALNFAAPGVGRPGGPKMARWLAMGQAARAGGTAALAAQQGFTADTGLLERDFFSSVYSISPQCARLSDDFGSRFALDEVSFKPWCAARQTMAASQALKEMVQEGLSPEEISSVEVAVPPPYLRMVDHGVTPGDRGSYLTSLPYQVAAGVLDPRAQFRVSPEAQAGEPVRNFMSKVSVHADDRLLEYYPQAWPARVTVRSRSGGREKLVLNIPGDPQRPFGAMELGGKLNRVLSSLIGVERAAELVARMLTGGRDAASLLGEIESACER